jgi:pimeloyl-ACP methyl ester carboxylesterase
VQHANAQDSPRAEGRPSVILIHGIRTYAYWFREIRPALEEAGFNVYLTSYGRYSLPRFLLPFEYFRNRAKSNVYEQILQVKQSGRDAPLAIIAHSFGTYIVARILQERFELSVSRIIFVASVVPQDFPFQQFTNRFGRPILNEVGLRDPWPAIAESATAAYGSTGTYGFNKPWVHDRWHDTTHSSILSRCHCKVYWIPFLDRGQIVPSEDLEFPTPMWIRIFSAIKIKRALAIVIVATLLAYPAWNLVRAWCLGGTGRMVQWCVDLGML